MGKASKQSCFVNLARIPSFTVFSNWEEEPAWKSNGIDPSTWSDGPVVEDTPMQYSYFGDPFLLSTSPAADHFRAV